MQTQIYADHAATTVLSPKAREAMEPFLQATYGNPSTLYSLARKPHKAVERSREIIAAAIHADPSEIFFTSGGTEADNWAIKGTVFCHAPGKGIITSAIEPSLIDTTNEALVSSSAPPKDEAKSITCEFAPLTILSWTKVALASSVLRMISATAFAGSVPPTVYSIVALPVYGYDWWNFVTFTVLVISAFAPRQSKVVATAASMSFVIGGFIGGDSLSENMRIILNLGVDIKANAKTCVMG